MDKLRKFVEEGGTLISFYDIPTNNEKMKQDSTLSSLYKAKIHKRENPKSIQFNGKELNSFHLLHSFNLTETVTNKENNYQNDIVVCDNSSKPSKIYAFHRSTKKGHLYHFGYIPSVEDSSVQTFKEFLSCLKISPLKSIHPPDLNILRLQAVNKEEFITVSNLTESKVENCEITLKEVENNDGEDTIHLKNVTILEKSSTQWSVNKRINGNVNVKVCTSEINEIRKRATKESVHYSVKGFHFKGSRNILEINMMQKPEKVISSKKDITQRIFKPDNKLRVQFKEIQVENNKKFKISVVYSDDLQLSLEFKGKEKQEIVDFNIRKKNNFLDHIS
jgi:hypothetical protein